MVCSRAGNETEGLDLEERKESEDLKLAYQLHQTTGFLHKSEWSVLRKCLLELGARIKGCMGEGWLEKNCVIHWKLDQNGVVGW